MTESPFRQGLTVPLVRFHGVVLHHDGPNLQFARYRVRQSDRRPLSTYCTNYIFEDRSQQMLQRRQVSQVIIGSQQRDQLLPALAGFFLRKDDAFDSLIPRLASTGLNSDKMPG